MEKAEQEELKRIVEALSKNCTFYDMAIEHDIAEHPDFQKLKTMAYAERHPEVQPNRVTALTWEQLLSMGDEAETLINIVKDDMRAIANSTGFNPPITPEYSNLKDVILTIREEKQRRLLNLLPNAKTE